MAQLITTKEKYGVSVATRLDPQLAHQIAAKAERLGLTMSKMVGMLITNAVNTGSPDLNYSQKLVYELQNEINRLQDLYKNAMSQFIEQVAEDDEVLEFVEQYNEILENLKENDEL